MLHDTVKNKIGQTYSPIEIYRAKMIIHALKDSMDHRLIASKRTLERWSEGLNTPSPKKILGIIDKIAKRPGLGGTKKSAELEDLYNIGPLYIPLWEALANEPYVITDPKDKINTTLINLAREIRRFYKVVERFHHSEDQKSIDELERAAASLRLALDRTHKTTAKYPHLYPFPVSRTQIIDVILDHLHETDVMSEAELNLVSVLLDQDNEEDEDMAILCPPDDDF